MNSDNDEGSSLVTIEEAYLGCLADCSLHKHHSYISRGFYCRLHIRILLEEANIFRYMKSTLDMLAAAADKAD
jgi:hypothetical protein